MKYIQQGVHQKSIHFQKLAVCKLLMQNGLNRVYWKDKDWKIYLVS